MEKPTFQMGKCNFCVPMSEKLQPVAQSESGVNICMKCLHEASMQAGQIPIDAITCVKCSSHAGFHAFFVNPTATISFVYKGNDSEGIAKYQMTNTKNTWNSSMKPKTFHCAECKFGIADWKVLQNPYAAPFFQKHEPPKPKKRGKTVA